MSKRILAAATMMICLIVAGCALDFEQLVPQTITNTGSGLPVTIQICKPNPRNTPAMLAAKQGARLNQIQSNTDLVRQAIPQLAAHPVVNAVLQHVQYISANSIVTARRILNDGVPDPADEQYLSSIPKPMPVAHSDVVQFTHTVAETVLRNTGGSPDSASDAAQQFWAKVKAYYTAYYQGGFINYFTAPVAKPTVQLTIGDTEITQAAGIFLELLFDQLLTPTVWTDSGKYYPGGGKAPTYLGVFNMLGPKPNVEALVKPDGACGMSEGKMNTLSYLVNTFSTAASAEMSITVKSVGGFGVGLGIFGKLSVGDNNTLTDLLQTVITEAVKRLTVAVVAPVLEAIEVVPAAAPSPDARFVEMALRTSAPRSTNPAQSIQMYSAAFVSGTRSPF